MAMAGNCIRGAGLFLRAPNRSEHNAVLFLVRLVENRGKERRGFELSRRALWNRRSRFYRAGPWLVVALARPLRPETGFGGVCRIRRLANGNEMELLLAG